MFQIKKHDRAQKPTIRKKELLDLPDTEFKKLS